MDLQKRYNFEPRLTIALGVYNGSKFLPGALDSLLAQTYTNFELLISDNASTDDTPNIIKQYAEKDPRIQVIRQPKNIGSAANFNFLLKQGHCEYFMWAACDDRWAPNFIEKILQGMDKDYSIISGFTPFRFIDENGSSFGELHKYDYSGKTALTRLLRFFIHYDDRMTYSIFRYSAIKNINLPVWWGKNKNTPLNTSYAFLVYILAKGNFELFGTEPLWFYCIKTSSHYEPFKENESKLLFLLYFILRKINVGVEQFTNIWRGSGNLILAIAMFPVITTRVVVDVAIFFYRVIRKRINKTPSRKPI